MKTNWSTVNGWMGLSEGGFVNHKKDPGKATNMGVTIFTLSDDLGRPATVQDVKNLTKADAERILKTRYWDLVRGDQLPSGIDYLVADYAVNSGPSKSVKDLQRTMNDIGFSIKVDGLIGPQTLNVLAQLSKEQAKKLVRLYAKRRMDFLKSLSTWSTFGRGWTRRVMGEQAGIQVHDIGVADRAMLMIEQTPTNQIQPPMRPTDDAPTGKAVPEKSTLLDAVKKPEVLTPLGSGVGVIFQSIFGDVSGMERAFLLLIVAAIGFGIYFAVRRIKQADPS